MHGADRLTPLMNFVNDSLPHYPGLADRIRPFFTLSYPVSTPPNTNFFPEWQHYGKGYLDACFVLTWIVFFIIVREVAMSYVLAPIAHRVLYSDASAEKAGAKGGAIANGNGVGNGHAGRVVSKQEQRRRERGVTRFSEQGFSVIYYVVYWSFGLYIYLNSPWAPFNPQEFWRGYPHTPLPGPVKFYYLTQLAEWFHQLIIINIEERRKDHWQMFSHHIITISLMIASYVTNFTRVGTMILFLMDLTDYILPAAKMLRYLGYERAKDAAFVVFLISWLLTRHLLFGAIIYSAYRDAPNLIPFRWSPSTGLYLTHNAYLTFIALLLALQMLLLLWFSMIVVVALKVVFGEGAEDVRSDEEDDGGSEEPIIGKGLPGRAVVETRKNR